MIRELAPKKSARPLMKLPRRNRRRGFCLPRIETMSATTEESTFSLERTYPVDNAR